MSISIATRQRRSIYFLFLITGHEIQKINAATNAHVHAWEHLKHKGYFSEAVPRSEPDGQTDFLASVGYTTGTIVRERGLLSAHQDRDENGGDEAHDRGRDQNQNDEAQRDRGQTGDGEAQVSAFEAMDQDGDGSISQREFDRLHDDVKEEIIDDVSNADASTTEQNTDDDDDVDDDQNQENPSAFSGAFEACGFAIVLAYLTFFLQHRWDRNAEKFHYSALGGDHAYTLMSVAAVINWVAMPATMFALGYSASCSSGVPNLAYKVYGGFFATQVLIISLGCYLGMAIPPFCGASIMESLSVLIFLSTLENFDIATDMLFPGTAKACSHKTTAAWLKSWKAAFGGQALTPILEVLQFDGFAVTLFTAGAFIPQLLVMSPFCTVGCFVFICAGVSIWVTASKIIGLVVILSGYGVYLGLIYLAGSGIPFLSNLVQYTRSAETLGQYCNFLIFSVANSSDTEMVADPASRLMLITSTRLIFENILQLWVQSSAFSLSFGIMEDSAKTKALVSMGLALTVFMLKWLSMLKFIMKFMREGYGHDNSTVMAFACLGLVPSFLLGLGPWLWVVAKICFAYYCESHVWNLSTLSCVQL